jgi:hypothetical protein
MPAVVAVVHIMVGPAMVVPVGPAVVALVDRLVFPDLD